MQPFSNTSFLPIHSAHLLDDPEEWLMFGHPLPLKEGLWESQISLSGMYCATCSFTIENALRGVSGVVEAQVNAATQRARIVWQSQEIVPSQWLAAIESVGYKGIPARDAFAIERRTKEQRKALWQWLVAGFCMMQVMMYVTPEYFTQPGEITPDIIQLLRWASWVLTLPVVFFSCAPFFKNACRDIFNRQVSMDLPVAIGMIVTFVVSTAATLDPTGFLGGDVYFDSLTMFVFFLLTGRWLELRLRDRTAGALDALMNRMPDSVLRLKNKNDSNQPLSDNDLSSFSLLNESDDFEDQNDAIWERVSVRRLQIGDVIRVLPSEGFPVDGVILKGQTQVDEALLTGESKPVSHHVGSQVIAGSHNLSASVIVQVLRLGADTRFAEIKTLMERASLEKPRLAQLADQIAKPFLWAVLIAAALAATYWWSVNPSKALMVAVAVLIVTCPCALSLATPAAMLAAAGALAKRGLLVRQLQGLEALAQIDTVVFDKTGTLTKDGMRITRIQTRYSSSDLNSDFCPNHQNNPNNQNNQNNQNNFNHLNNDDLNNHQLNSDDDLDDSLNLNQQDKFDLKDNQAAVSALILAAKLAKHSLHPVSRALVLAAKNLENQQQIHWQDQKNQQNIAPALDNHRDIAIKIEAISEENRYSKQHSNSYFDDSNTSNNLNNSNYFNYSQHFSIQEISGCGLEARFNSDSFVRLGSLNWCQSFGLSNDENKNRENSTDLLNNLDHLIYLNKLNHLNQENFPFIHSDKQVHLFDEKGWLASFDLEEDVRSDADLTIQALREMDINVHLLSGDNTSAVARIAKQLTLKDAQSECSPDQKLAYLQRLQKENHRVAMVGDGLNDGPVLAGAHASFAFGQAVPLAQSKADFVVMGEQLIQIPQALMLARQTMRVVRQNLFWAAFYNAICVPLAVLGWLPPWLAGLGMALSSLWVVLNAMRLTSVLPVQNQF